MEWVKARRKKGREYPFRLAQGTPLRAAGLAPMDTSAEQYTQWIRVAHIRRISRARYMGGMVAVRPECRLELISTSYA